MAKIVLIIEDKDNEELDVKFTADTPLPETFEEWTLAQILAGQLHDLIDTILKEPTT